MSTEQTMKIYVALLILGISVAVFADEGCHVDGEYYVQGAAVHTKSFCLTDCVCVTDFLDCDESKCEAMKACYFGGEWIAEGKGVESPSDCEGCVCVDGDIRCHLSPECLVDEYDTEESAE
ncbi:von Willebrand factor C and EGF domain-containing protein-like [Physella acuta]|uniref:von Willebrand factor C and EGF domain-containing protein-like n=1 Tax=Physella acuta TaxID=109671 RepID=UPI0027DBBE91|nr:von Willebrand factor C and EGF domain-containing protein-like [Physella acuta]